jgi:hypothetical protein
MAAKFARMAGLALALAAGSPALAQLSIESSSGARYLSGGVGEEERAEMLLMLPDYNLKVIAAAQGSGAFIDGVVLVVLDARGGKVFETTLNGPWLMGQLPPGRYELLATYGGTTQKRTMTIPARGQRVEYFYWPVPGAETLKSMERQEQRGPGAETLRLLERQEQQVPGGTK